MNPPFFWMKRYLFLKRQNKYAVMGQVLLYINVFFAFIYFRPLCQRLIESPNIRPKLGSIIPLIVKILKFVNTSKL